MSCCGVCHGCPGGVWLTSRQLSIRSLSVCHGVCMSWCLCVVMSWCLSRCLYVMLWCVSWVSRWGLVDKPAAVHQKPASLVSSARLSCESSHTSSAAAGCSPAWRSTTSQHSTPCSTTSHTTSPQPLVLSTTTSFADILRDELLQTATFEHTTNKSLALIQVHYWPSRCSSSSSS